MDEEVGSEEAAFLPQGSCRRHLEALLDVQGTGGGLVWLERTAGRMRAGALAHTSSTSGLARRQIGG